MVESWLVMIGPMLAPWAAFFAVLLAWLGIYVLNGSSNREIDRQVQKIQNGSVVTNTRPPAAGTTKEGEFLVRWLEPAGGLILPQNEWRRSILRRQLVFAGFRQPRALMIFLGAKLATALAVAAIVVAIAILAGRVLMLFQIQGLVLVLFGSVVGFFVPDVVLRSLIKSRRQDFVESFPDALDMLVVCVEAGLGLDAALNRVAREL
jgi:tight adherence protein C